MVANRHLPAPRRLIRASAASISRDKRRRRRCSVAALPSRCSWLQCLRHPRGAWLEALRMEEVPVARK